MNKKQEFFKIEKHAEKLFKIIGYDFLYNHGYTGGKIVYGIGELKRIIQHYDMWFMIPFYINRNYYFFITYNNTTNLYNVYIHKSLMRDNVPILQYNNYELLELKNAIKHAYHELKDVMPRINPLKRIYN